MFSPKRNAKRSAEEAVAAPSDDTKQTAAQSLANLGGEDVGVVADLMDAEVAGDAAAAASTPKKKAKTSKAMGEEEEEVATRRSTRGAAVSEAVAGEGEQDAATIAVKEEVSTALPESTTPRRVAGANVLASLGGSGTISAAAAAVDQAKLEASIPTLPPIVEVATAEGMAAQHDYLLQNLVHVSTWYRDEKRNNQCR